MQQKSPLRPEHARMVAKYPELFHPDGSPRSIAEMVAPMHINPSPKGEYVFSVGRANRTDCTLG